MIEVKQLTKRYGEHTAVSNLSFCIEPGHIYGLLGPNGAGKSTTMNIMTGCLAATSGSVTVGGYDIFERPREAKRLIGYLPEQPPIYQDRTPKEYLTFVAQAKGVPKGEQQAQIARAMEVTGITDVADRLCKNLSKGYRQRVGIAQALLGNPEVVILDEPTVGLDPRQMIEIRDLIRSLGEHHTVILSSHILSEVRAVCDTILIISKGKLVACDSPENLERHLAGTAAVELTAECTPEEAQQILTTIPEVTELRIRPQGENRCSVRMETASQDGEAVCRTVFLAFAAAGRVLLRLEARKASLEEVFLELTGTDEVLPRQTEAPEGAEGAEGAESAESTETQKPEQNAEEDEA